MFFIFEIIVGDYKIIYKNFKEFLGFRDLIGRYIIGIQYFRGEDGDIFQEVEFLKGKQEM